MKNNRNYGHWNSETSRSFIDQLIDKITEMVNNGEDKSDIIIDICKNYGPMGEIAADIWIDENVENIK